MVLKCRNKENQDIVAIKKFKESEDDEIMEKSDFEAYQERTLIGSREAIQLLKHGSQEVAGKRKPVAVGEGLPPPKPADEAAAPALAAVPDARSDSCCTGMFYELSKLTAKAMSNE